MIKIKTALHEGISKSDGGGETRTQHEWKTGPRNLMTAIKKRGEYSQDMTRIFGAVGHRGTWIEIDGIEISDLDLNYLPEFNEICYTEWSKLLIVKAQDGTLAKNNADATKEYQERRNEKEAAGQLYEQ